MKCLVFLFALVCSSALAEDVTLRVYRVHALNGWALQQVQGKYNSPCPVAVDFAPLLASLF